MKTEWVSQDLGQSKLQIPMKMFSFILEKAQEKGFLGKTVSTLETQRTERGQKDSGSNPGEDREKAWLNG